MRKIVFLLISLAIVLAPSVTSPRPARAAECQFVLGFLSLQQMIPEQVGNCVTNVQFSGNGDGLQPTTGADGRGGLLVWRKLDNFTAFTDGFRTWINGPFGLQIRLNTQRYFWESNPEQLPVVPVPAAGERCHTAALSASLQGVDAGAGNFVGTFVLKNNLSVPCTFFGFPGAQLRDAQNNALPTNVVRGGGSFANLSAPGLVSVPSGGVAAFKLHWTDVPSGGEQSCPTASQLAITPPDEFSAVLVQTPIVACGGGRLDASPIVPVPGTSNNWSGYASTGGTFTAVTGSWVVPSPVSTGIFATASNWVGIGGTVTRDLIQAGTEDVVSPTGEVEHNAWFELLPDPPERVALNVNAGDSMTVSITRQPSGLWLIIITNNTTGRSFRTTVSYASSLSSAEWVEEAPSFRRQILPLANFGTVAFSGASAVKDGARVTIAQAGAQALAMIDSAGNTLAVPSALTLDGAGFTVTRHP